MKSGDWIGYDAPTTDAKARELAARRLSVPEKCIDWQHRYEASQRMLARAMHENRVRDECLTIAMNTLKWYASDEFIYRRAHGALTQIKQRLAELEPEREAKSNDTT